MKRKSVLDGVLDYVRTTHNAGYGENRTQKYYAAIRNGVIRVQVYNDSDELQNDYTVAL